MRSRGEEGGRASVTYLPAAPLGGGEGAASEATEAQRHRQEIESKLAANRHGSSMGGRKARDTKRDNAARKDESLLAAVRAYRAKHPSAKRTAIAAVLLAKHSRIRNHADPKAIDALRKRIARLEARARGAGAVGKRKSKAKRYKLPDLPDGRPWWHAYGFPPKPWTLALERERLEREHKLARIHEGGAGARPKARETKRRARLSLLAAVEAHRQKHPDHRVPAIARALLPMFGRRVDHADAGDRKLAIDALARRIRHAEKKALDT